MNHIIAFSFPLIALLGYYLQRPYLFLAIAVGWLVLLQNLDDVGARDRHVPWAEMRGHIHEPDARFAKENLILYVYVFVDLVVLGVGIYQFTRTDDPLPWILYAVPAALSGVSRLTIAHELMHGSSTLETILARIASVAGFWIVHEYEHLFRHHRDEIICTDVDKSYAKLGQSFYSYIANGLPANFVHAWETQSRLLKARGAKLIGLRIFLSTYLPSLVLLVLAGLIGGLPAVVFFLLQAVLSVSLFLLGTYNQHYGLTRRRRRDGSYEPFTYMNTWSADFRLTNRLFWNLACHAHHHLDPFCSFTDLKIIEHSPLLPHGYLTILGMSLVPPLWFKVMNPRVAEVLDRRDQLATRALL